jgi:hypothetical protein
MGVLWRLQSGAVSESAELRCAKRGCGRFRSGCLTLGGRTSSENAGGKLDSWRKPIWPTLSCLPCSISLWPTSMGRVNEARGFCNGCRDRGLWKAPSRAGSSIQPIRPAGDRHGAIGVKHASGCSAVARHAAAGCQERITKAVPGDGGQSHDRQKRQAGIALWPHRYSQYA